MSAVQSVADLLLSWDERIFNRSRPEQLIGFDAEHVEVLDISNVVLAQRQVDVFVLVALEFCRAAITEITFNLEIIRE